MTLKAHLSKQNLPANIMRLIQTSLKENANVLCEVIIVAKTGEKSGTTLTLTIDSSVNYDEYVKENS